MPNKKKTTGVDAKIEELEADLQRVQADFINFRRRAEDERGAILELAKQDVILQLLPLIDNLDRALGHIPSELADNDWAKGVSQIAKQAEDTLKQLGVERIPSAGQPFDHNLHEAVAADESGEHDVVIEELQPGYRLGDKVIRHAMVKVGKK